MTSVTKFEKKITYLPKSLKLPKDFWRFELIIRSCILKLDLTFIFIEDCILFQTCCIYDIEIKRRHKNHFYFRNKRVQCV